MELRKRPARMAASFQIIEILNTYRASENNKLNNSNKSYLCVLNLFVNNLAAYKEQHQRYRIDPI